MNPSANKEADCFTELKTFRFKNPKKLIISHLNINSLKNKFESIKPIISSNFDIFLVSETRLEESFPKNQFSISSYRCLDKTEIVLVEVCLYGEKNIAPKQLNLKFDKETQAIYLEINIRLRKWLIIGLYKPPSQYNSLFLKNISTNLSRYLDSYENTTLLGDFNMTPEDKNLQHITDTVSLEHLIIEPTCFKGSPSCVDLIIINRKSYFKNTCVTVTGISDFHKLTAVSLKSQILKAPKK